ncbi:hypothetical protein CSB45_00500 [candidate division KSB3 bacterium]|uniref:Methyltransferase type 11 domain-containing protein n=1 Tax=candidate division KSB3 bacterium TaxID=2044937 RepID=A0A2G6EDX6_9BACT|nr:MAG: hypothetical protein CSB45_00500 [candidate division KSB3 bacterium]
MTPTTFETQTREIFHEIHKIQGRNEKIFTRLLSLLTPSYLQEREDFFKGKICLDAGCGSNANAACSMLQHGAEKVYAFDLTDSIFETVPHYLRGFEGRYALGVGSVLNIHFADGFFDFVHCSGVLHHSSDVATGLKELARVTKPGGMLYIMTYGKGGLLRDIVGFLRKKYRQDSGFQAFIDGLNPKFFTELFQFLLTSMQAHGDAFGSKLSPELLAELFDEDLVLTIKDRVTAPVYHEHSEEELRDLLEQCAFSSIIRITRYPELSNFRRFLSPLYENYESRFARLLYGSGSVQLKAVKAH